nr:immunoglobulin heavy chain junction region [Mus musculus]
CAKVAYYSNYVDYW